MMINNCSLTVYYCSILTLEIIGFFTAVIYHGKLTQYFYNIAKRCLYVRLNVDVQTIVKFALSLLLVVEGATYLSIFIGALYKQ